MYIIREVITTMCIVSCTIQTHVDYFPIFVSIFSDAKDMDQLTKNNITHILSIHDNAQPVLEVQVSMYQ